MPRLQEATLLRAEMKRDLQLGGFARSLGAEEDERRVRGHDRTLI